MKIKCPVALCGWEGHPNHFWKHVREYEKKYEGQVLAEGSALWKSHQRWANYFFSKIFNSDLTEEMKWTNIAHAYIQQQKDMAKKPKIKENKLNPDGSDKIEMKDGKYFVNDKEYTPEEFSKIMPGIKVPNSSHTGHPEIVKDITGELRINDMTPDQYRKEMSKK